MKTLITKILKDALKRYLPLIINTICATLCVTQAGCVIAGAETVDINFTSGSEGLK